MPRIISHSRETLKPERAQKLRPGCALPFTTGPQLFHRGARLDDFVSRETSLKQTIGVPRARERRDGNQLGDVSGVYLNGGAGEAEGLVCSVMSRVTKSSAASTKW
jgi:hypothetical protein